MIGRHSLAANLADGGLAVGLFLRVEKEPYSQQLILSFCPSTFSGWRIPLVNMHHLAIT